jgi:hypothetical protein
VAPPAFDQDLGFPQRVEDLDVEQLVAELGSVTPIERIASATGVPCPVITSTWRSLATISSGVCLFLRGIGWSSSSAKAETWDGPLHGGQAITLYRWVQRFAPELEKRTRRHLRPCRGPWHVDETYVRVGGEWRYLYVLAIIGGRARNRAVFPAHIE